MKYLVTHPPKYELEDGSIQVWRGMPKLPDVVSVMLDMHEKEVRKHEEQASIKRQQEWRELEQRRKEHPEEFFSLADVFKQAKELHPGKFNGDSPLKEWPKEPKEMSDAEFNKREQFLRQQAKELLAKEAENSVKGSK